MALVNGYACQKPEVVTDVHEYTPLIVQLCSMRRGSDACDDDNYHTPAHGLEFAFLGKKAKHRLSCYNIVGAG